MGFLKAVKESIYSPQFYAALSKKSFSYSLGYFIKLILLASLIQVAIISPVLLKEIPSQIQSLVTSIADKFPPELSLAVVDGEVITNVSQPYFIPMPDDIKGRNDPIMYGTEPAHGIHSRVLSLQIPGQE